jgi:hypothetical protein
MYRCLGSVRFSYGFGSTHVSAIDKHSFKNHYLTFGIRCFHLVPLDSLVLCGYLFLKIRLRNFAAIAGAEKRKDPNS